MTLVAFGNKIGGLVSESDLFFSGRKRVDFLGDLNGRLGPLLIRKRAKIAKLAFDSGGVAGMEEWDGGESGGKNQSE
jgi:hypothetical protein